MQNSPELLGIILSPLFTLTILTLLEEYKAKWHSKYETFKFLYAHRGTLVNYEVAKYLNIIDIIFIDDKKVRKCWKELYNELRQSSPSFEIQKAKFVELLNAMAVSLGLDKDIEYSDISNTYYPNRLVDFDQFRKEKSEAELNYFKNGADFFKNQIIK